MGTKGKWINGNLVFYSNAMHTSTGGNITSNQRLHTSTTETAVLTDTVYANTLNSTSTGFRVVMGGEISSTGTGDCTLILYYGSDALLTLATSGLPNEDDLPFKVEFTGHVLTAGASGKIVCTGKMYVFAGTPLTFMVDAANTGASADLTADGSIKVTADWDASSADNDIIVTHGWVEYFR